jgi:NADH-quinone oxidoreductase subunit J
MAESIIFYILALVIAIFSIMTVTSKQIIRSATYLLFVLIATAGLYLLLGYQYLFAVQIAVYAGGVMVLFIFAISFTNRPGEKVHGEMKGKKVIVGITAVAGFAFCGYIIYRNVKKVTTLVEQNLNMQQLGETLMGTQKYQYLLPFELISVLLLACIVGAIMIARKR